MKNLLLVSLDTVRADVAYNGRFAVINDLIKEGVVFDNVISSSPLTPISHATVFTGLQPYNHGIRHLLKEKLNLGTPTLATILQEAGYQTGAIVSCPGMNSWYGFSCGFEHYDDEIPLLADGTDPLNTIDVKKRGTALKRAEVVAQRAQQWLANRPNDDRPFCLFTHFFDAHWPYEAPVHYEGENPYEAEVAYSAHYLGELIDWMKAHDLWEQTTVVCFSDHGEDLEGWYANDKGGVALGHPEESGHGCLLYDQTQKVVLIIKDASMVGGHRVNQQVRLVDVLPTILDLLKLRHPAPESLDGVSLLPTVEGKFMDLVAYSETFYPEEQNGVTDNKFPLARNKQSYRMQNAMKVIMNLGDVVEIEAYNLATDPNEKNNLIN